MAEEPKPPKPFVPPDPNEATRLYWDRLDAKFANMKAEPPPPVPSADEPAPAPAASDPVVSAPVAPPPVAPVAPPPVAPVVHTSIAPASAVSAPPPSAPSPSTPPASAPASGLIAEAFAALLALEDGQPGARPVRLTTGNDQLPPPPPPVEPKISDEVIEQVVRRVIERLGPDTVRAVVVDVVSQVSERLVKEEIDRIRNQHA